MNLQFPPQLSQDTCRLLWDNHPVLVSDVEGGSLLVRRFFLVSTIVLAAVAVPVASASSVLSTSNSTFISLGVNAKGEALVKWKDAKGVHETLAYGAVNASAPKQGTADVDFKYDYSGGYTLFKDDVAKATGKLRADQASFKKAQAAASAQGVKYTADVTKFSKAVNDDYKAIADLHKQSDSYDQAFSCPKYTGP